jgi:hypothetical protein
MHEICMTPQSGTAGYLKGTWNAENEPGPKLK